MFLQNLTHELFSSLSIFFYFLDIYIELYTEVKRYNWKQFDLISFQIF